MSASQQDIAKRFRDIAKRTHPDLFLTFADRLMATRTFQPYAEAYGYLRKANRPVDMPVTDAFTAEILSQAVPTVDVSKLDILELLRIRAPLAYGLIEIVYAAQLIPMTLCGFAFAVLMLALAPLRSEFPNEFFWARLINLLRTVFLRWGPAALLAAIAIFGRGKTVWRWPLLACAVVAALLTVIELAAQLHAALSLRTARRSLRQVLAEADQPPALPN